MTELAIIVGVFSTALFIFCVYVFIAMLKSEQKAFKEEEEALRVEK